MEGYFDHLSKHLIGERAEVEIAGLKSGDHIEARWVPLIGITYESKGDVLEIALERLDHLIHRPRDIIVTDSPEGLESMEVVEFRGTQADREIDETPALPASRITFQAIPCGALTQVKPPPGHSN